MSVNTEHYWPAPTLGRMIKLVEAGVMSTAEIGEAVGKTKNAVIGKAYRMGITGPRSLGPRTKPVVEEPKAEFPPAGHCVFPLGHPRRSGFRFCGAEVEGNGPYCAAHRKIAFRPAGSADD